MAGRCPAGWAVSGWRKVCSGRISQVGTGSGADSGSGTGSAMLWAMLSSRDRMVAAATRFITARSSAAPARPKGGR